MEILEAYNSWAVQYDTCRNRTRDLEKIVAKEYYAKVPMTNALELGCGTGLNTLMLLKKAQSVLALDFSENMLAQAKKRLTGKNFRFKQTDIEKEWPIEEEQFDFVSCSLVLEHIENLIPVFQKSSDALVSGGHFYLCEFHPVKQFAGSKPRFDIEGETQEVPAFIHRFTDYAAAANKCGLETIHFNNHFDIEPKPGEENIPRLISFLFKKP